MKWGGGKKNQYFPNKPLLHTYIHTPKRFTLPHRWEAKLRTGIVWKNVRKKIWDGAVEEHKERNMNMWLPLTIENNLRISRRSRLCSTVFYYYYFFLEIVKSKEKGQELVHIEKNEFYASTKEKRDHGHVHHARQNAVLLWNACRYESTQVE